MGIEFTDEQLGKLWDDIDWPAAEEKLRRWQGELTKAAFRKDSKAVGDIQKRIVRDMDIKCLAVRHVANSGSGPGVDGVRWRTPGQMMRAAMRLTSKDYHAQPLRQINIISKNTGKERKSGIPTYFDRAINVLYGYSFIPVAEAQAERKSFAFRPGRSTQDAQAYVLESLKGNNAPSVVVCGDIKAYFSHIHHSWLLENVPMDKKVLRELLSVGIVFAGELFPAEGEGISEGANLSPYLGNYVLDGLQKYIYRGLFGTEYPDDFANGNLIRFADDILITVRTRTDAERVIELLSSFLAERGLTLSKEKTNIRTVDEGFDFLGQTFIKKNGFIYSYPSERAVQRIITNLKETIQTFRKSQRDLIILVNQKLRGWANYHRYSDARDAFKRVDAAVQAALLEAAFAKHPKLAKKKVIDRYWYKEADGRHCYALPEDKSVRVIRLADTLLLEHAKIKTNANPFLDTDYIDHRTHASDIRNVNGKYRAVWERQGGICFYCGRPILVDQPRTVVQIDLSRPPSIKNSAYIHKICEQSSFEVYRTMEDIGAMTPYDVMAALGEIEAAPPKGTRQKKEIPENWKHIKLKQYFAACTAASVTLTFKEIEKIDGRPLPASARKNKDWWYPRQNCNMMAEAWLTEGYSLKYINFEKGKIQLVRDELGRSKLEIPKALTSQKLPDNAVFELQQHMAYIIKKYQL